MPFLDDDKPIIACSTGSREDTAIAVIRLSGFSDIQDLDSFFTHSLVDFKPRKAQYTTLVSPQNKQHIDDVVLTFFKAPYSYNGENILEISCHGNQLNIERIIRTFVDSMDIRVAQNGEFTYRALKNQKLNLSQVEGLDLFLNSQTEFALNQGLGLMSGSLQEEYLTIHDSLTKLKASMELMIDFSEDVGEEQAEDNFRQNFSALKKRVDHLYHRLTYRPDILTSPQVVLAGPTNAGKSTLFNLLLNEERAITSNIPGTTRDFLSENLIVEGNRFRLLDTAGIRHTDDEIESEGVSRSHSSLEKSFFRIYVVDPRQTTDESLAESLGQYDYDLLILTHLDTIGEEELQLDFEKLASDLPRVDVCFTSLTGPIGPVSEKTCNFRVLDRGSLLNHIRTLIDKKYREIQNNDPLLLQRHRQIISELNSLIEDLSQNQEAEPALRSAIVDQMAVQSSQLIGAIEVDQVLETVFENFCIGK